LELSGLNNPIDKLLKSIRMLDEESQQNEKQKLNNRFAEPCCKYS
jgi:hypothetical protein